MITEYKNNCHICDSDVVGTLNTSTGEYIENCPVCGSRYLIMMKDDKGEPVYSERYVPVSDIMLEVVVGNVSVWNRKLESLNATEEEFLKFLSNAFRCTHGIPWCFDFNNGDTVVRLISTREHLLSGPFKRYAKVSMKDDMIIIQEPVYVRKE